MERPFAAYKGDEPYVFVSYAHRDDALIYPQLVWLNDRGFNIWYDHGIEAGTEWREEIARSIRNSQVLVYFVTDESVQSDNCKKEVNYAIDEHIPIIAIHMTSVELPGGLKLTLSELNTPF